MIKTFRKKPVEIQAIQWEGDIESLEAIEKFMGIKLDWDGTDEFIVPTLEDGNAGQVQHVATVWDYIIRGVLNLGGSVLKRKRGSLERHPLFHLLVIKIIILPLPAIPQLMNFVAL